MDHTVLKRVILEQYELIKSFDIASREQSISENDNRVLVEIRRFRKTTMLYHLVRRLIESDVDWDQIIYII